MKHIIDNFVNKITEYYLKNRRHGDIDELLSRQSPGINPSILLHNYYFAKVKKLIYILLAGALIGSLLILRDVLDQRELNQYRVPRNTGGAAISKAVDVKSANKDYGKLTLDVKPRKLTQEEIDFILLSAEETLRTIMLGDNAAMDYVDSPLRLVTTMDEYPVSIRWETSDYMLMHENGDFGSNKPLPEGSELQLRMYMSLEEQTREYVYPITIYPKELSDEEREVARLYELIDQKDNESSTEAYLYLPDSLENEALQFRVIGNGALALLPVTIILLMLAIWVSEDKDLRTKNKERSREMLREYPEFVGKLKLLIESGMSIRSAVASMAQEYRQQSKDYGQQYLYEELIICDNKLREGASESVCLEAFGRRCGVQHIRKLSTLLVQNLRKGNSGLSKALEDEVRQSYEERKNEARRLGEEATTKLIFPMILELGVVMLLIMIPAYMSFGM